MKRLYKIWRVDHNVNKPVPKYCPYVHEENGNWAYPLVEVISTMSSRWNRDDFVSLDRNKIEGTCKYFNDMADDNEHYEIREVDPKKYEHLF